MLPLTFGTASVDFATRINWDELRKKRMDRANTFMKKYGIGSSIIYHYDRTRYLASLPSHPYSTQTPKSFVLFIQDAGFPYMQGDRMMYQTVKENCPWFEGRLLNEEELNMPHPCRYDSPEHAKQDWAKTAKQVKGLLKKHGVADMPVSVDFCSPYLYEALRAEGLTVVDGNAWFDEAMMVKFDEEILAMKMVAAIQERAWGTFIKDFRIGMKEMEGFGILAKAAFEGGADYFEGVGLMSGERNAPRQFFWSDRIMRPGDFVSVEIHGLNYCGYKVCYDRTFLIGAKPTALQKEIYQTTVDMQNKFKTLLKPGVSTRELAEWRPKPGQNLQTPEALREYRTKWSNHFGGVGIFWDSAPYLYSPEDPEIRLEKNMTVAYHSLFWLSGKGAEQGGVAIENTYLITEDGCESLTKWPYEEIMTIGL